MEEIFARPAEAKQIETQQPEEKAVGLLINDNKIAVPLSQYQKANGTPYTVDFFKIDNWQDIGPEIAVLEELIADKIGQDKYQDSLESYKEIIRSVMEKIGIGENELPVSKISKLIRYFTLLDKNKSKEQVLESLLQRVCH